MKYLKIIMLFILSAFLIMSCDKDNEITPGNLNEVENLQLIQSISKEGYKVEMFNITGKLVVGFNRIFIRITDKDGKYLEQSTLEWMPMMTMNMGGMIHQHSTPFSEIQKTEGKQTLFEGNIVFIMASDEPENFWDLEINFTVEGQKHTIEERIMVTSSESEFNKIYTSAMSTDGTNYMLALVEPSKPIIGTNDIVVALYKMGEHHDFPVVDNYKIRVDPRMPGMGNHSAPGNVDMTQGGDGFYHGKVGFSMSGYWMINLILEDDTGTIIKGESITEQNPGSSLNFKLEF